MKQRGDVRVKRITVYTSHQFHVQVTVQPNEMLFDIGESSDPGIFIVLEGSLGVFLTDGGNKKLITTLEPGESIGDFDVLDGESL